MHPGGTVHGLQVVAAILLKSTMAWASVTTDGGGSSGGAPVACGAGASRTSMISCSSRVEVTRTGWPDSRAASSKFNMSWKSGIAPKQRVPACDSTIRTPTSPSAVGSRSTTVARIGIRTRVMTVVSGSIRRRREARTAGCTRACLATLPPADRAGARPPGRPRTGWPVRGFHFRGAAAASGRATTRATSAFRLRHSYLLRKLMSSCFRSSDSDGRRRRLHDTRG